MKEEKSQKTTIAALADIHFRETDKGMWISCFEQASAEANVLLLCGDLTDTGDETEAEILVEELKVCTIPIVAVLGNHDYEKNRHKIIRQILMNHGIHVLDGEAIILEGIGFAGVKGFGGGFDNHMLSMFGEAAMKAFVQEAVNEALHLDRALAKLDQEHEHLPKIALMHYAPIQDTVSGEPEVIYPFLGSSRLAEPLSRRNVLAAFHGHAHAGTLSGKTSNGVQVFNVAKPILRKSGFNSGYLRLDILGNTLKTSEPPS